MTRDYSQFLPSSKTEAEPRVTPLEALGWQPFFAQQISIDELTNTPPVRVTEVHRNALHILGEDIDTLVPHALEATVGDWLLFDPETQTPCQRLERKSLFKRRAPGHDRQVQMIAANVDTAFIVTSCNQDFNVARLERYIALAFEADATPVILLTKADLTEDVDRYLSQARAISDQVPALAVDALSDTVATALATWCKPRQTIAFMGSSGVGKSTLVNSLSGAASIRTQGIREDDAKGRHTTTSRQLHFLPNGCAVLDTPGMRELQMTDAASGIGDLFSDLDDLASRCKFSDCQHQTEPGCAILAAIEAGDVDQARMARWQKLVAEEKFNSATLAERRSKDKAFGKMVRNITKHSRK